MQMTEKQIKHKGVILSDKEVNQLLNEQDEKIKELEQELNAFKPVIFQDDQKGTILLYIKDYGDIE